MAKTKKIIVEMDEKLDITIIGQGFERTTCNQKMKSFENLFGKPVSVVMHDDNYVAKETVSEGQITELESY